MIEQDDEVLVGVLVHYARSNKLGATKFWVGKWTGERLHFMDTPASLDGHDPIGNVFLYSELAIASE